MPLFTAWWSWRVAVLIFLAMPLGGLLGMIGRRDPHRHAAKRKRSTDPLPASVRWIASYGLVSGLATSAMIGFLPLFAHEDIGWTEPAAGFLIAVTGFAGIGARMMWPRLSERGIGHGRTLRILAGMTTVTAVLLALASADLVGGWALYPAAFLLGSGAVAWNAVGMLAVMDFSPEGAVGKGTGLVLLGFLSGLAFGALLMGFSVDELGSYTPGWIGTAVLLLVSGLISFRIPQGTIVRVGEPA